MASLLNESVNSPSDLSTPPCTLSSHSSDSNISNSSPHIRAWRETLQYDELDKIASACMQRMRPGIDPLIRRAPLGGGSSATVFLYSATYLTLGKTFELVARLVYPWRRQWKTEAEVATMNLVRARTSIPVPEVYLYCSTSNNPVGAEWILMEYMPGTRLCDVFDTPAFTLAHKKRMTTDLVSVWSQLYTITSSSIGSVFPTNDEEALLLAALRYNPLVDPGAEHRPPDRLSANGRFKLGPLNDFVFCDTAFEALPPPEHCGPFGEEEEMLAAIAFLGQPPTRPPTRDARGPGEKILELLARWKAVGSGPTRIAPFGNRYHLAHGDLMGRNILVSAAGRIIGVLDFEYAAFVPPWAAAAAPDIFDDDEDRCIITDDQDLPFDYAEDNKDPAQHLPYLRAFFRSALARTNLELLQQYWHGVERRAMRSALSYHFPGNAEGWLLKYTGFCSTTQRNDRFWRADCHGVMPQNEVMEWILSEWDARTHNGMV